MPEQARSDDTVFEPALRAWAREVERGRRPVDVDAILGGSVPPPPRRRSRRHLALLALVATVVVLLATFSVVVGRDAGRLVDTVMAPATDPGRLDAAPPAPPRPSTSAGSRAGVTITWTVHPADDCPPEGRDGSGTCSLPPVARLEVDVSSDPAGGRTGAFTVLRSTEPAAGAALERYSGTPDERGVAVYATSPAVESVEVDLVAPDGVVTTASQSPMDGFVVIALGPDAVTAVRAYGPGRQELPL